MRSYQAFSDEVDNLDLAVEQLAAQIETFDLSPNTGGILYCGSELDTSLLCSKLWNKFHLPFIGTTCTGQFTNNGYREASICLNLFTGDDICFSGGMSGVLTNENMAEELKEAYRTLKSKMSRDEITIVLYIPWLPGVIYDDILDALSEVSEGAPIFGGVCSDEWQMDNCHAMYSGGSFTNRAAMLLVGGNFNPKYIASYSINWSSENTVTVTKASGATVYEFDNQPALDYLASVGLVYDHSNIFIDCLASPMVFRYTTPEGNSFSTLRNLYSINFENKSVTFAGRVKQNSQMTMVLTSMLTIKQSINDSVKKLFSKMDTSGDYKYTGILVSSCTGRYCLTVADKNTENSSLLPAVERGLMVAGGYLNGEFCPVKDPETGRYTTLLNNETFTLMAF